MVVLIGAEVIHVLEIFLNDESQDMFIEEDEEPNSTS
jgi:membrane protein